MDFRLRVMPCLLASVLALSLVRTIRARAAENEQTLGDLEHAWWRYVQDSDLPADRNLWRKDFLGWPLVSETAVHKDITAADQFTGLNCEEGFVPILPQDAMPV